MQNAHCIPESCVVGASGLALPATGVDYASVVDSGQFTAGGGGGGDFSTAMYVNTVWEQANPSVSAAHPAAQGVYYDTYAAANQTAVYGYPGQVLPQQGHHHPAHLAGAYQPGQLLMDSGGSGGSAASKRKRRRVITYEQRKAANVRERKRMCHLNDAFDVLRKRVPTFAYEKKLSRIETLKLAVTYIQYMAELVDDIDKKSPDGTGDGCSSKRANANSAIRTWAAAKAEELQASVAAAGSSSSASSVGLDLSMDDESTSQSGGSSASDLLSPSSRDMN